MPYRRTGRPGAALFCAAVLTACATVPPTFPAATAEDLANRSIQVVWGGAPANIELPPDANIAGPSLDASSRETTRLKIQMARRFADLRPLLDSGAIGLSADGYVAVHDVARVPEDARNTVRTVVANENADRAALYRDIAETSKQLKWVGRIRDVFATRWIALAAGGWWYQDANGAWKQK